MATKNDHGVGILLAGMGCPAAAFYEPLLPYLDSYNLTYSTVERPSLDPPRDQPLPNNASNGLSADIATIRTTLLDLITRHADDSKIKIVPVAHSYAGAPILEAVSGLWRNEREENGERGGIDAIALIASALPVGGGSIAGDREKFRVKTGGEPDPAPPLEMSAVGPLLPIVGLEGFFASFLFPDFPADVQAHWVSQLRPQLITSLVTPISEAVKFEPSWNLHYLKSGKEDLAQPPEFQDYLIGKAKEAGASVTVTEFGGGHFPMVLRPEDLAKWVRGIVDGL